ncbi:uncharacterized protein VTP21DRAFT_2878 [Calcarisporiella thermophila]|uniref:uncharacterized protein n=1 Tax=Calcarisporiella thermophila TaxID=911321 RepID=UPI0037435385
MQLQRVTSSQVRKHNNAKSCWIIIRGRVYDVTSFIQDHPGGEDLILDRAGEDVTLVMADPLEHEHSESAYEMLEEYLIGELVNEDTPPATPPPSEIGTAIATTKHNTGSKAKFLDLTQPLFPQMCRARFTKDFYMEQVHLPKHINGPARIFQSDAMELLTKTPWYVIPTIWVPVSGFYYFLSLGYLSVPTATCVWFTGLFLWTLIEYVLHRFLFHIDDILPDNQLAFILHFFMHGIHHYIPMDRLRLVMPPALFIILSTPLIRLAYFLFPRGISDGIVSGAIFGYVCYDLTHYYLHHGRPLFEHLRQMKTYHLDHHYKNAEAGFGVTVKFWDYVFGTQLA